MFTGDSSEKLRIAPGQVQIDTTHFRPQALTKSGVSRTRLAVNRTAVVTDRKRHVTRAALAFAGQQLDANVQRLQKRGLEGRQLRRPRESG
jgi:hypothetical protein